MSIKALNWAFDQALDCAPKFVLVALADYCDADGVCFPSQSALAEKCGLTRQGVGKILAALVEDGYIVAERRMREDGGKTASTYRLLVGTSPSTMQTTVAGVECKPGLHEDANGKDTPMQTPLASNIEPPVKNRKKEPARKGAPSLALDVVFPKWWPTKAWDAFVAMRKAIKHPLTDHAIDLAIKRLSDMRAAGQDPEAVLNNSTLGSYRGLFEARPGNGSTVVAFEQTSVAGWRGRLEVFFRGGEDTPKGSWSPKWGPKPGEPGCKAPKEAFEPEQRRASV